jgi:hypothetical protein
MLSPTSQIAKDASLTLGALVGAKEQVFADCRGIDEQVSLLCAPARR